MMNTVNETVTIAPCKSTTDPAVQKIEGEDIYMKKLVTNTESMILCHCWISLKMWQPAKVNLHLSGHWMTELVTPTRRNPSVLISRA